MLLLFLRKLFLTTILLFHSTISILSQQTDPTFGTNGFVLTNIPPASADPFARSHETAVKAFNLPDGKILVLAQVNISTAKGTPTISLRFLRYSNNGTLESTTEGAGNFVVNDAIQQPDGKIIAVGHRYGILNYQIQTAKDWIIARFNLDGSLDTSFNSTGIVTRGFANNEDIIHNAALQADGKIVVSGTSENNANGMVTVVGRFNSDGSVDSSFGPYGEGFFDIYDEGSLSEILLVKSDGKILLGGTTPLSLPNRNPILIRYNSNGAIDTSFGNQGVKIIDYGTDESLYDAAFQADGKIVLLADSNFNVFGSTSYREREINVIRLNNDGSIDLAFGVGGRTQINTSPPTALSGSTPFGLTGDESPANIIVQENGHILFSSVSFQLIPATLNQPKSFGLLEKKYVITMFRLNPAGEVTGQNFSRRTLSNQAVSSHHSFQLKGILMQPDGKVLVYGTVNAPPSQFDLAIVLARYTSLSAVADSNNFFDYNFDGRAEIAVYRSNNSGLGTWFFTTSGSRGEFDSREFGAPGDQIAPGDYDGDGIQDLAVFRPSTGEWITRKIYLDNCAPMNCVETVKFGANGDIPAPGDYDGDGKFDRAVYRPSEGTWYILFSTGGHAAIRFGLSDDKPVTGDYDGDGKSDVAVIRRRNGQIFWYILQSSQGFAAVQFGLSEDKTTAADYNGDGKTDIAVWRPSNGTWYVLVNYTDFFYRQFGTVTDIPIPADYDGDRKTDFAVYTPSTGSHVFIRSSNGTIVGVSFGLPTDIPIASVYVR